MAKVTLRIACVLNFMEDSCAEGDGLNLVIATYSGGDAKAKYSKVFRISPTGHTGADSIESMEAVSAIK